MSHKAEAGEWRSLASCYILTTGFCDKRTNRPWWVLLLGSRATQSLRHVVFPLDHYDLKRIIRTNVPLTLVRMMLLPDSGHWRKRSIHCRLDYCNALLAERADNIQISNIIIERRESFSPTLVPIHSHSV